MILEEINLILACESAVTDRCDYFNLWRKCLKHNVKAYLVVARSGTAVSHCICSESLYMAKHFERLEHPFRTN